MLQGGDGMKHQPMEWWMMLRSLWIDLYSLEGMEILSSKLVHKRNG